MSLINRYPTYFSVTQIIGNSANDYSTAPRNKQNFFNIANVGSSLSVTPDYYYPMRFAPAYNSQLKYQPFESVQETPDIFSGLVAGPLRKRRSEAKPNSSLINKVTEIQNMPNNILSNMLAGRYANSLFN
jgi:hypothetical protein